MTTRTPFLLTILLFPFILLSCKSTDTIGPNDSSGNSSGIKGKISGYVKEMPGNTGLAGVRVETIGFPYSTTTDSTGHYELEVPSGTYHIALSKEGCGESHLFNFVFSAPGIYYAGPLYMSFKPSSMYSADSVGLYDAGSSHYLALGGKVNFTDPMKPYNSSFISFYTSNPDSISSKALYTYDQPATDTSIKLNPNNFDILIPRENFLKYFNQGQTVYYTITLGYCLNYPFCGGYFDRIENKDVWTSIGPRSKVYSFQMP